MSRFFGLAAAAVSVRAGLVVLLGVPLLACSAADPLGAYSERQLSLASSGPAAEGPTAGAVRPAASDVAEAQPQTGKSYRLEDCVDLALRRNPKTKAAYLAALSAASAVGVAKAAYLPSAEASLRTGTSDVLTGPQQPGTGNAATAQFSVSYLIFDGGARAGRLEGARAQLEAADFQHRTTLLEVALEVEESYYRLQGALWYQSLVEEIIKQSEYQYKLAEGRYEVGLARRYDLVRAKASLAQAEVQRTVAESQVRKYQGNLSRSMGLDVRMTVPVEPMSPELSAPALAELDWLLEQAVMLRPELGQAKAKIKQALANSKVALAGYYPSVTADAGVSATRDSRPDFSGLWTAGAGLTVPIFSGFETTYDVRRTRYDEEKARAELADLVSSVQFEVWAAHSTATDAAETAAALQKVVEAAQEAVNIAEENYRNGLGTIVEVFDSQGARASAQVQLVQARLDWYLARARLERAVVAAVAPAEAAAPAGGSR